MLGVMQGRLLPKYQGRYQAHPVGYWQDEFKIAADLQLECIEFILDYNDSDKNPLLSEIGIEEVALLIENSGVSVQTVCADYFMEAPLHSLDDDVASKSIATLQKLIELTGELGVTDIVIPCVDQSSLKSKQSINKFVEQLNRVIEVAEDKKINLSLETDLAPYPFIELLDQFDTKNVTVNYDIGNSAALGYDPVEEIKLYGDRITDIHIKDRELNGGSVILGTGHADFDVFFKELLKLDYHGPFIMQAYRDDEGVDIFKSQLQWIKKHIDV